MNPFDVIAGVLLVAGCLMSLGAGIGLLRFPDVLARLHAGSKPQVFGLLLLLAGVGFAARSWSVVPVLVLAWVMQLLAIPVASHMVGRSGYRNRRFRSSALSSNDLAALVERMSAENEEQVPAAGSTAVGSRASGDADRGSSRR